MDRIPRKIKKKIPVGVYCYTPLESPSSKNGWVYKVKPCAFYKKGECRLIKCEIEDQCKSCGINYGKF